MTAVRAAVVIPVKAFHAAKVRLAPALDDATRAELARRMATGVVAAAGTLPVTVVCDDPAVRAWADSVGAAVCWTPGLGLDGAVAAGVAALAADGVDRVVVAHADLPLAVGLDHVVGTEGVSSLAEVSAFYEEVRAREAEAENETTGSRARAPDPVVVFRSTDSLT